VNRTVQQEQSKKVNVDELYKLFDKYKLIGDDDRKNAKEVNGDGIMQVIYYYNILHFVVC
jgi:hypothetical protein